MWRKIITNLYLLQIGVIALIAAFAAPRINVSLPVIILIAGVVFIAYRPVLRRFRR